jgi:glycosyltransferase involved in cell wall biosynthesis/ubiquinone/menaquinone biosynthesis C-methylase UbiE
VTEDKAKNETASKLSDCMPTSFIETLVEDGSLVCPNCHSLLNWMSDSIKCPICKETFKCKNGAVDFYNRYKNNNLENLVMPDKYVKNVANALGFKDDKDTLDALESALCDTFLVSEESNSLTAEIRELSNRLKIPPPSIGTIDAIKTLKSLSLKSISRQLQSIKIIRMTKSQKEPNISIPINSDIGLQFEEQFIEPKLNANETIYRSIRIKNTGSSIISSDSNQPILISYHWLDNKGNVIEFEGLRSHIPKVLYPGDSITVITSIKTPATKGHYVLRICPVQEHVKWLEDIVLERPIEVVYNSVYNRNHLLKDLKIFNQTFEFNSDQNLAKNMIIAYIRKNYPQKNLRILEIGAGIFPQSIELTNLNCMVISTDISFAMCQLGSLFYTHVEKKYNNKLFCFMSCNALNLPIAEATIDGVIIFAALHHFPDPVKLLLYLRKFVNRDGFFAIMREPCNPNPWDPDYLRDIKTGINEQMWSIEEYSQIFENAALELKSGQIDSGCSLKVILSPNLKANLNTKKRIIICSNFYPPNFIGGAELIAHDYAKMLRALGHNVVIFAGDNKGHGKRHSIRKETYEGLTIYRVTLSEEDFLPSQVNFIHRQVEENFKNLIDRFLPDLIHFHNIIGLSVGLIHVAKNKGIKTVLTLHDHWGFCYKNTLLKRDDEICTDYTRCADCMPFISGKTYINVPIKMREDFLNIQFRDIDVFISPSQYLADTYIKAGLPKEKFRVIWNGVNVKRFANISKKKNDGCVRFTFIGYFGKHKGIHILLEALPLIGMDRSFIVNLVGEGELLSKYKQQVESKGLDNLVKFWGKIDNIEGAYSETDVLILPSIWPENQPVTITEAMASRIPVIASDIGGNPELIEDGKTGYLFEPANPRDLADKMKDFILHNDKIKSFGDKAYKRIENNTFENQISKIIKIYDEDINRVMQTEKCIIIACVGHQISPMCIQAMRSVSNRRHQFILRFLMADWLQEDQLSSSGLIWIVDQNVTLKELAIGLINKIPLLVPDEIAELRYTCIKGNCGLYYRSSQEAEACLEYLIENESIRIAMGNNGFKFYNNISKS